MARVILSVAVLAFTVYCLVDVVRSDKSNVRNLPKFAWAVVTVVFPIAGGVAWLMAGRPQGSPGRGGTTRGPLGPDDDPDFLRGI